MHASISNQKLQTLLQRRDLKQKDKLLVVLYYDNESIKTVEQIRKISFDNGLREVKNWNITAILRSAKGLATNLREGWSITLEGKSFLSENNLISENSVAIKNAVDELRNNLMLIKNKETVSFLEEAITCLESDLKRAAVVLSWVGAVSVLYNHIVNHNLGAFNAEAKRRDTNWRPAKNIDDLSKMKESEFLNILETLSIIGKNVKQELQNHCLQLRNACGHPNSLAIGPNRVASHIEILTLNVFSKF